MEPQKTIPIRAELFDRIEEEAQLEGKSIEEFLEAAVQRYLATIRRGPGRLSLLPQIRALIVRMATENANKPARGLRPSNNAITGQ